ncbi:hypothetical protein BCR32DRAFT_50052 [Anaeromyces robustus]|uniref:Uncharacterized protein n=1 Tax=Anaeromyces robustus TaxID=1754192 RepID=A0A1Y1WXD0_9FUNG|nr:hypothetical protein BCR32DRAFT_50052 [Anaeromyces robustus]|eukprot:ORX78200.1 hypothetical protein BCR32DRAFT_50052 [Anaeromyces robustus]
MEEQKQLNKNSPEAKTCPSTPYDSFFEGFNSRTKDTFFYAFIIQFILVGLMYIHVGKGRYWKVLFYASVAGLSGALIEHSTLSFICQKSQINEYDKVIPFFVEEFLWIICEYAIPYLNLIKMEAISKGRAVKYIRYAISFLLIPFAGARLYDGYDRMMKGYLNTKYSLTCHGIAFGTMAVADIICTIFIIYFIKSKNKNNMLGNSSIGSYIKNSSYTILICVDIVSFILSTLYIVSAIFSDNKKLESSTTIFHCLKSNFILILATDALIFKYGVTNKGSTGNSKNYSGNYHKSNSSYKSHNYTNLTNGGNNKNSTNGGNNFSIDMTSSNFKTSNSNPLSAVSPFNYPSLDRDYYKVTSSSIKDNPPPPVMSFTNKKPIIKNSTKKPIIKNHSDIPPSSINNENQTQQFGYLYQQMSTNDHTDLIYKGEKNDKRRKNSKSNNKR